MNMKSNSKLEMVSENNQVKFLQDFYIQTDLRLDNAKPDFPVIEIRRRQQISFMHTIILKSKKFQMINNTRTSGLSVPECMMFRYHWMLGYVPPNLKEKLY